MARGRDGRPEGEGERPHDEQISQRLQAITRGIGAIAAPVTVSVYEVLQRIADVARELVGARYCALGIGTDPSDTFHPWVFSGMATCPVGRTPHPVGLLGSVPHENRTIRLADLHEDDRFLGFPAHHPAMHSFLGVPIRIGPRGVGNIYLTDKIGAEEFSKEDEQIIEMLAAHAGVAMESARLYEEARQRAAELQEEKVRRETFVTVVAHDLRGLLAPIINYGQLLKRAQTLPAEKRERALDSIVTQGHRISRLVTDLLDVSHLMSSHFTLLPEPMDLVETVRSVVDGYRPEAKHQLIFEAPQPHLEIIADRDRIAQVAANLVGNALKYSPEGTTVRLRVEPTPHGARVSVTDQGIGIDPREIPLLFEPYSRLYRERRAKGLGLGLYIAKGIVDAHGGSIEVASPGPGRGSTFSFTLPRQPSGG